MPNYKVEPDPDIGPAATSQAGMADGTADTKATLHRLRGDHPLFAGRKPTP